MSAADPPAPAAWRDLIRAERLPQYALICAGTWLTAADTLMTATIMPSVARDIGGYAWFGWAVAGYLLGAILAGASAGRLSLRIGLQRAMVLGALAYAAGCVVSALAPNILLFLAGRVLQGVGGGWVAGLGYVAVTRLFPQRLWSRALSGLSGVWGAATLLSPLIGGLFAEAGVWRGAFWLFGVQGLAFAGAAMGLIGADLAPAKEARARPPLLQVGVLAAGVLAIAAAGLTRTLVWSGSLGLIGLVLLAGFLRLDSRAATSLLPRASTDLKSPVGLGAAYVFCMAGASASLTVYGPILFQALYGASPVLAGYILGCEAFAWTGAAVLSASSGRPELAIRVGALFITVGLFALAWVTPRGGLLLIAACAAVQGAGFGLSWSFNTARMTRGAGPGEQALASASVPTLHMIGTAAGAAAAGAVANLLGFGEGMTRARALVGGFWLFACFAPLAIAGCLAAWRLTGPSRAQA